MALVLVEGHQAGHRHRSQLEADEEHQEVVGTDHEEHAQQRREGEDVKLALLVARVVAPQPRVCLQADDECTDGQDGLHDAVHRFVAEHSAEERPRLAGQKRNDGLDGQQDAHDGRKAAPGPFAGEEVVEEEQDDQQRERHLGPHVNE